MLKNFKLINTAFKDLIVFNHHNFNDKRGSFSKLYSEDFLFKKKKIKIKQINFSLNKKRGTIRGMHYQIGKFAEEKIVTCISGKIFDVVIDLRKNSKTYLKSFSKIIKANSYESIIVPPSCANAILTLKHNTILHYYMGDYFNKKQYMGIRYDDKFFKIKWPFKPKIINERDRNYPDFKKTK